MYLKRYHDLTIETIGVRGVLLRNGLNRLPRNTKKRSPGPHYQLYEKQVPGHHIQLDVKFLTFLDGHIRTIRRFQYTAIDDATRIRALKVYTKHTQQNAINFIEYVIRKMPFRIKMVRTDNGHSVPLASS